MWGLKTSLEMLYTFNWDMVLCQLYLSVFARIHVLGYHCFAFDLRFPEAKILPLAICKHYRCVDVFVEAEINNAAENVIIPPFALG